MSNELINGFEFDDCMVAIVKDKYGNVLQEHFGEDLITTAGKAAVAALILTDVAEDAFDYIAIGSGATAANVADTTLDAEIKRAAGVGTRVTTAVTNDTAQIVYTFSSGVPAGLNGTSTGSQAVEESGVLNASSAGDLLCRQTFSALNIDWDAGDTLQITWKIQVS